MDWEPAILKALAFAGRPMRAAEITDAVLGELPHPDWVVFQSRLWSMCRRRMIERVGTAPRGVDGYRYRLPDVAQGAQKKSRD